MTRLRVLLDGRIDGADGIGRCTRSIIAALQARDAELDLRVLAPTGTPNYSRRAGAELAAAARRERAQVIHTLDYRIPIGTRSEVPLIVTVHDVLRVRHPEFGYPDTAFAELFGPPAFDELVAAVEELRSYADFPASRPPVSTHQEYLGRILALAVGHARLILTPTQSVATQLAGLLPDAHAKTRAVHWGVDHLAGHSVSAARRLPRPYVLYVGQARNHKGFPELLEAVARSATFRHGAHLVLAGRDFTADAAATVDAKHALGADRVHALGEVSDADLAQLYSHAAVFVHLAQHEGFGFPPLEALAHGCPVIASDIPTLRETLGEHAEFCDPHDSHDVAGRLDTVVANDHPAARRSRTAWAGRYRWSTYATQLLRYYREVADG